jgi:hypothetical protein
MIVLLSEVGSRKRAIIFINFLFLLLGYLLFIVVATYLTSRRSRDVTRTKHSLGWGHQGQDTYARFAIKRRLCHLELETAIKITN